MHLRALITPVIPDFPQISSGTDVEVLREIPVETLYLALKNADNEVALWFFENALPEQVQGLIDIDCWKGDEFLPARFENFFKAISLLSPPKLGQYMKKLDAEIVVRGLLEYFEVLDFDPQNPPEVPDEQAMLTPDNKYALILKTDRPDIRECLYLFFNKYSAIDIEHMRRIMEACKWEQSSDLEDFAYQVKKGRLEEMGFVDRTEALALYSVGSAPQLKRKLLENPLPAGTKTAGIKKHPNAQNESFVREELLPAVISGPLFEAGYLYDSFKGIIDPEAKEIIFMELLRVTNASLAADDILSENLERIQHATVRSRRYLDLGLSYLADAKANNAERGTELLASTTLSEVYRLGWLVIHDLTVIREEIVRHFSDKLFEDFDRELLKLLQGRHPELNKQLLQYLKIDASTLIHPESAFKVGLKLAQLGVLGRYFTQDLGGALKLKERPLAGNDSAYKRLLTGLLRQSAGEDFNVEGIKLSEWKTLAKNHSEERMQKAAELLKERCPESARALFAWELDARIVALKAQIIQSPAKTPEPKYFDVINWRPENTETN